MVKAKKSTVSKAKQLILPLLILLILALVMIVAFLYVLPTINNRARYQRITNIYDSLQLSDKYILKEAEVFGDKRIYPYDSGRSYSSAKYYIRAANVDTTMDELSTAAKAAGFVKFDEPYPGTTAKQYHFKSAKNEYLRISVSSKLRDDAFQNSYLMDGDFSEEAFLIDPNAGPSDVTIKVNLDDNNE